MADIVSSVIKGSSRTVSDASKVALNAMLAQPKMMLQFYKAVPVLGKLIENTTKEYKKTSIAHVKSLNQNTTAISELNKSLNTYTQKLKGTAPGPTSQVTPTTEGSTLGKVAMVGLIAAAIANDRVRESALSVAEIAVKGVFKATMGSDEYKKMEKSIEGRFTDVFKIGQDVGKGIRIAADALSPVVKMLGGITRFIGRLAGAEGDLQETIAGGLIGGAGLYALNKASPLLNFMGARSGAKKGVAAALGQAAGQSLAINATNVYINASNIMGGAPGVNSSRPGRGAPGKAPGPKPTIQGPGRFGAAGNILAAIAGGYGVSQLFGGTGSDGEEGDGQSSGSNLGLYGGLAAGVGSYFAPDLIRKYYQSKMTNVPGVDPFVLKDPTTKTTPSGKKITSYPAEENRIARQNYDKQLKESRRAEATNILNERKSRNLIKYAGRGAVGVGVGLTALEYMQEKSRLKKQLDAGAITKEQYDSELSRLRGQLTGGAIGSAIGAGIGALVAPGVGAVIGGVVGGMIGSYAGGQYSAPRVEGAPATSAKSYGNNASYAMKYLQSKGLSREDAAAIVGNLVQESNVNPNAHNKSEGAFGIAQWRNERFVGLQRFAASQGKDWKDLDVQLDYLMYELQTTERGAWNRMQAASNVSDKAAIFDQFYERSKGTERGKRISNALSLAGSSETMNSGSATNTSSGLLPSQGNLQSPTMKSLSLGGSIEGENIDTSTRLGAEAMRMFDNFKQIQMGGQQSAPMMPAAAPVQQTGSMDLSPIPSPTSPRYLGLIAKEQYPFQLGGA